MHFFYKQVIIAVIMCGIAGIISFIPGAQSSNALKLMTGTLEHRGPAGEGFWNNEAGTVNFGHRRLAIIDLTEAASQPMHYLHYTIIFNGEIYNYKELREQLKQQGYHFTSTGDTEVIPAAYDYWGIDFLQRLDGMFAFALYDLKVNKVIIARDRFGEKPLYYSQGAIDQKDKQVGKLFFASEMKALWSVGVPRTVNNKMLFNYLTLGFVQNPAEKSETFYNDIYALPPAHFIEVDIDVKKTAIRRWYDPAEKIKSTVRSGLSEAAIISRFSELFYTSVARRLRSDVPVGTSLSGGLDSSAIVSMIQKCLLTIGEEPGLPNALSKAFSAVFPGFEKDESTYSKLVTDHFNIKQYLVAPTATDLADQWQCMMYHQEEPVQSSSAFTQFMVYALAKEKNVTVLLDGQGADEILGGYKKYSHWYLQQLLRTDIKSFRREKKLLAKHELLEQWSFKNYAAAFLPRYTQGRLRAKALGQQQQHSFISKDFLVTYRDDNSIQKPLIDSLESILFYNSFEFGLGELLRYADRNSMAHSREVRLPFLFHELVEFVFCLPSHYKIRHGFTKWILRQAMDGSLPKEIVWRTGKTGFEPPQQLWLQQEPVKEIIMSGRAQLVKAGVLKSSVLNEPVMASGAHAAANDDWRYMNAAAILNSSV